MNARRPPNDRLCTDRSEDGFTLIELIISVVILGMMTAAISVAFVTGLNSSSATNVRVHTSDDAQTIAAFLIRDAQAAGGIDPTNPTAGADGSLGVSKGDPMSGATFSDPSGCFQPGVLVFRFAWRDWVTPTVNVQHIADYFYVTGPNTKQLVRQTCVVDNRTSPATTTTTLTLGNNITSLLPTCNGTCPGIPDFVSLTITETHTSTAFPSSSYTYTLNATVRPQNQTVAAGTPVGFPSLLSLGGCSTGTASGTPGLAVSGNLTAGIYGPVVLNATDAGSCHAMGASSAHIAYTAPGLSLLMNASCTGNRCPGTINADASPLADPFGSLPAPADCSHQTGTKTGNSFTAGAFTTAVTLNGSSVLASGNYTFCAGVTVSGTVNATPAAGVLLYVADGPVSISGSLTINPQASGAYKGLSLWFGSGAGIAAFDLSNVSLISPTGIFYAPSTDLSIDGPSHIAIGSIIAQSVSLASNNLLADIGLAPTLGAPSPSVGPAASSATISGTQFLPSTNLSITVGGQSATITSGSATDANGSVNATFTIPDGLAPGNNTVIVSDGVDAATSGTNFTVTQAHLVFTSTAVTGPASATANLGPITIQELDAANNPVTAPAGGTVVNLASNSTGTAVFSASSGGAAVTQVTIPPGSSSVNFFYGDTKKGTPTLTASSAGLTSVTQSETISAAAPSALTFTNCSANGGAAGSCGSGATVGKNGLMDGFVSVVDAFGNTPTVGAGSTWSVAITSSSGSFVVTLSPVTITGPASQSGTRFHVKLNGNNGSATLTAHAISGSPVVSNGTMTVQK